MDSTKNSKRGLMKDGKSTRKRAGRNGRGQGIPRIMIVAGVLIIAGAAWLYWPSGDSAPTGLGERHTVVSGGPALAGSTGATGPSSGDVDIDRMTPQLTPETPENTGAVAEPTGKNATIESTAPETDSPAAAVVVEKAVEKKPAAKPRPQPAAPPIEQIKPTTSGGYAVQVGSFGNANNADQEVERLTALGWQPLVRAGNNSSGEMVFRVWITWFPSRQQAQQFIDQNRKQVPGAIPVHR